MKIKNAVLPLVVINVIVFVLQLVLGSGFTESFLLLSSDILIRPWILVTSMFLHGGLGHLFFNMYILFMFGSLLERRVGIKKFIYIYFISGIIASIASSLFYPASLGASGAIYGVLGAVAVLIPELRVMPLFIPVPMKIWTVIILFAILDLFVFSGVAVAAHLAGAATGAIYAKVTIKKVKAYHRDFSSKTHLDEKDVEEYMKKGRF